MLTLASLRKDRELARDLHDVIDVLKNFAVMQLRMMQQQQRDKGFLVGLEESFRILNVQHVLHPFLKENQFLPKAVVVITSDEGFTGELNSLIIEEAELQTRPRDQVIVFGERGINFFRSRDKKFTEFKRHTEKKCTYIDARNLTIQLADDYLAGRIGKVFIVYSRMISLTKQIVATVPLLPFYPQKILEEKTIRPREVIIEPDISSVIGTLIRLWMIQRTAEIFWESRLAHTAARILQLEGSFQELKARENKLRYQYFKLLHHINDSKLHEILANRICT